MTQDDAVEVLYQRLGALPTDKFGTLNIFPFAQESAQTNALKRAACEGVVQVFRDAGYPMVKGEQPKVSSRDVTIACRSCSSTLLHTRVDDKGMAHVPAATVISGMAARHHQCPHDVVTPEDQRRKIEEAVLASRAEQEAGE